MEERIDLFILTDRMRHLSILLSVNTEVERIDLFILEDRMIVLRTHPHSEAAEIEKLVIGLLTILDKSLGMGKTDPCTIEGQLNVVEVVMIHPYTHGEGTIDLLIHLIPLDSNVGVEMSILDE